MRTNCGVKVALEILLDAGIELGVFTNEPDGAEVALSDLEEPKLYGRVKVPREDWKLDPKTGSATAKKQTIEFGGKGAPVNGYFLLLRGELYEYVMFQHPIPNDSNQDLIHLTPTIRLLARK